MMENDKKKDMTEQQKNETGKETESLLERSKREKWEEKKRRRQERKNSGKGKSKLPIVLVGSVVILFAVILVSFFYKRYSPSNKMMPLSKYFQLKDNEVALMVHDTRLEDTGFIEDGQIYIPYEVVQKYINKRFYFDSSENILSYATAYEVIRSEVGSDTYQVNKSKAKEDYTIVKSQGEKAYIALDFVKKHSNVEYPV